MGVGQSWGEGGRAGWAQAYGEAGESLGSGGQGEGPGGPRGGGESLEGLGEVLLSELIRLVGFIVSKSHPGKLIRPALEAGDFPLDVTRGAARVAGGNKSRLALEEEPEGLRGHWGEDQDSQGELMQVCPRAASGLREPLPMAANKQGRCLGRPRSASLHTQHGTTVAQNDPDKLKE